MNVGGHTITSPATVSRVLNNPNYKCSVEGLREKIWKTAMELNYTPNEAARSLKCGSGKASKKKYVIDVLVTRMNGAHADPVYNGLIIIGRCSKLVIERLRKFYKNIASINRNSTNYAVDEVLCDGKNRYDRKKTEK